MVSKTTLQLFVVFSNTWVSYSTLGTVEDAFCTWKHQPAVMFDGVMGRVPALCPLPPPGTPGLLRAPGSHGRTRSSSRPEPCGWGGASSRYFLKLYLRRPSGAKAGVARRSLPLALSLWRLLGAGRERGWGRCPAASAARVPRLLPAAGRVPAPRAVGRAAPQGGVRRDRGGELQSHER